MANCVIFCAGAFHGLIEPIQSSDYIIAADGGYRHTTALGLKPNASLGDFDSLGFVPEDAKVFPVEKDDTDAMLAIRHGLSLGYKDFVIYGALEGPRHDHTLANLQSLLFLARHGATGCLVGKDQIVTTVKNETLTFPESTNGTLSVFAMEEEAQGVTLKNVKYPLENGCLSPHFPLGVSNQFTGKAATVAAEKGVLLVFYPRQAGILREDRVC